jgi:transposase
MSTLTLTAWQRRRLQRQLQQTPEARVYRRTLAVLEVSRGAPVQDVARRLGVSRRSVYHWLDAYTRGHDPEALRDDDRPGRPGFWTRAHLQLLNALLRRTPDELGYFAANWTVPLLQEQLERYTDQRPSDDTVRRGLQRLHYVWKRCRYVLDPDPELEKKTAPPPADPGAAGAERAPGR